MLLLFNCSLLLILRLSPVIGSVRLVEAALLYFESSGVDGGLVLVSCLLIVAKAAVYCVIKCPSERFANSLSSR